MLVPVLGAVRTPLLKALAARAFVRDPDADPVRDGKGRIIPDPDLRDTETIPITETVEDYLTREVLPWAPDAYVPDPEGRIGYEIPLTRLFHRPVEPRPSAELKAELRELADEFQRAIGEVLG